MSCIVLNIVVMMMDRYPDNSVELIRFLYYLNIVFTLIFVGEMILVILAIGPRAYLREKWHAFDGFIVVSSVYELFAGGGQQTQDMTKFVQKLINLNLVIAAKKLGIKLVSVETDGYDYELTIEIDGQPTTLLIEFKAIADTPSTDSYFATGNKISALKDENGNSIGKKVPLMWTIKYHVSDDGLVDDYASFFLNNDDAHHEESGWFASESKKVSLSQYIVQKSDLDAVDVLHGRLYYTTGMKKIYNLTSTYGPYTSKDKNQKKN